MKKKQIILEKEVEIQAQILEELFREMLEGYDDSMEEMRGMAIAMLQWYEDEVIAATQEPEDEIVYAESAKSPLKITRRA